jgi:hypothetical protein
MRKLAEYTKRGLPHVWSDGRVCQCRECREAVSMGLGTISQYYDQQTKAQQSSRTDFPFIMAWVVWYLGWSLPLIITTSIWQTVYHTSNIDCFVLWSLSTLILSLVSTLVTRYGHKHLGWWGSTPNNEVDWDEYERRTCAKRYWAAADAKNGLHRSPGLDSGEEKPTDEFALDQGLLGEFSGSDLPYDPEWATPLYHGGRELEPHRIKRGWSVKISFKREGD